MPADPAAIMPVLTMPPPALTSENTATSPTKMPLPYFDAILPLLLMPPEKVDRTPEFDAGSPGRARLPLTMALPFGGSTLTEVTTMACRATAILPLLLIPPKKRE